VDEVLAVGDSEFQKKCLGKMQGISKSGRTIVFVSHQMNQIRRLCERVVWIDSGQLRLDGPAETIIGAYEQSFLSASRGNQTETSSGEVVSFSGWEVLEPRGSESNIVSDGSAPVSIRIDVLTREAIAHGKVAVVIYDSRGFLVSGWSFDDLQLSPGEHYIQLSFPDLPLRPGAYSVYLSIHDDHERNHNWTLVPALVIEGMPVTHFMDEWAGVLNIPCSLECKQIELDARIGK
jgi:lipopolysaccharide transport system ATP-binding protein